jgi:hypothetical protein
VWWLGTAGILLLVMLAVERRITWYLAVDQYGYLTFAHDLAQGRVFHDWPLLPALRHGLPRRVDVLVQTYVYDDGRVYCRYAPGFPLVLAVWLRLFGDDGAHFLNPTVFLALLVLTLAFQARLFRSRWRAMAGTVLIILFPTYIHLWALTLTRDLAGHLSALIGLFLLLPGRARPLTPGRVAAAALAIGYAGSIRPDALLYAIPASLVAVARWYRERRRARGLVAGLAAATLGLVLGLAPLLAYNWVATGSPLRPTQGMEIEQFLSPTPAPSPPVAKRSRVAYPPGAWRGGTATPVQGGGLQLANLPYVLPGNIEALRFAYGDLLLGFAVWGALLALLRRRALFLVAVPYCVAALLFFSCWGRPDVRYLVGLYVFIPMLIVEGTLGTLDVVRRLARTGRAPLARGIAAAAGGVLLGGAALLEVPEDTGALPVLAVLVPGIVGTALLAAAAWPRRRIAALAAPTLALALGLTAVARTASALDRRASFQRPEMLRARATFARAVEPGAVVITTEDVGRPAENIDYYSGVAHALYLTDLERWRLPVAEAAYVFARARMPTYLFIPRRQPGREQMLADLRRLFTVELVADVPPEHAIDYFVAAAFHRGVRMELYRLVPRGN